MIRRLTLILVISLLATAPGLESALGLSSGIEWSAAAAARAKHPKSKKNKSKTKLRNEKRDSNKHKNKHNKQTSQLTTVPQISSLASTAVTPTPLLDVKVPQGNKRIDYKAITVYFNRTLRIPSCVAYQLTATIVSMTDSPSAEKRRSYNFARDPGTAGCPDWGDYRQSGYTRGHMAPAMDMRWDKQVMTECFYMTNMCPQDGDLNNGPWRRLEERTHRWAKRDGVIWIYTGPIMEGSVLRIGPKGDIAVPKAFYKVLYAPSQGRAIAFIYENKPKQGGLEAHATTIAEVERRTGITFFPSMPSATAQPLKRQCDLSQWQ